MTTLQHPLSATKLRNALRRVRPDLVIQLKNIRINGRLDGCSGFITDPDTNKIVYTRVDCSGDPFRPLRTAALYRTAAHDRDYTGGRNNFADDHPDGLDGLPQRIIELLEVS